MVHIQKAKCDAKFNDISKIDGGKEDLRIKARVIRMWKVPTFTNPSEFSSLEMVLMDEKCEGVSIIAAWFDCVVEGLDMLFTDDQSKEIPKFRMKMKLKHGDHEAVFAIFYEDVKKLAMETCPLLPSMERVVSCILMKWSAFMDMHNFIQGENDACIKEDAKCLNAYHSSCESNKVAEGDVGAGSSSQFVYGELGFSNKVVNQVVNGSPDLQASCFQRQRKTTKNGMSTYVEKFDYARRKSCVKRKLCFDDKDDDVVIKSKVVKNNGACSVMFYVLEII
ncbi:hypothetical protein TSUD_181290 [Trifolium subterraneum]|uniref:Replication factor A C-terminal domain-containing protein n=1 Tax=Trifolium subterraneum TaxID=3900 RepID=A0A2Z6MKF2_TRISU|nr:hypothetical protein TSUD_181290 [Trifolium subterraneum]